MSEVWLADRLPPWRPRLRDWPRIAWRGLALALVVYAGLGLLLLVRLIEAPLCRPSRPVTPFITQAVCRIALRLLGLRLSVRGRPMTHPGASVANHAGWLDVFVLNAAHRVYFVAKSEVSGWPGIGLLAQATGTVFITRKGTEAARQQAMLTDRLKAGHRLLFFPEGTSTDSRRILPFKSTLFAAFFAEGLREALHVQPVTVAFDAPAGQDPRLYGWWGDMDFASHLLRLLATPGHGRARVTFHPELAVTAFPDRKQLSRVVETTIRSAHPCGSQIP